MTEIPILMPCTTGKPSTRRYEQLKQELMPQTTDMHSDELFSLTIIASHQLSGRDCMDTPKPEHTAEQGFLLKILFKPNQSGLRLRPEETQLLLSYIGEILKEVEDEEMAIIGEHSKGDKNVQS